MRKELTDLARGLRRRETDAERKLWSHIRDRQIDGWKFKRQVAHGRYVLDFFCFEASLVIEVDGTQHADERVEYDRGRTAYLEQGGLRVLRFWNSDVLDNINSVLETIYLALGQQQAPSPGALRRQKSVATRWEARGPLPRGRGDAAASAEDRAKK